MICIQFVYNSKLYVVVKDMQKEIENNKSDKEDLDYRGEEMPKKRKPTYRRIKIGRKTMYTRRPGKKRK